MAMVWQASAVELLKWSADIGQPPSATAMSVLANVQASDLDRLSKKRLDGLYYLALDDSGPRMRVYDKIWAAQSAVLIEILDHLAAADIEVLVVKGSEVLRRCFMDRPPSILFDVDLMVRRVDIERVKVALHGAGLMQSLVDPKTGVISARDVGDIARMELEHYELAPFKAVRTLELSDDELAVAREIDEHPIFVTDKGVIVVVEVDVHHQLAADIEADGFLDRSVASVYEGAKTLSPADYVWFTTSRYYVEVALHQKRSLRDFAYLNAVLSQVEPIDWDVVLKASSEFGLYSGLYYYFAFLNVLSGGRIPAKVVAEVRPDKGLRNKDFGWQLGALFDFVEELPGELKTSFVGAGV